MEPHFYGCAGEQKTQGTAAERL
uniref:Uncharacterized protein n=1 Tax=Anguilla anguilla TaxID=7936 RepID=A0A0E9W7X5_ANGAN